MKNILYNFKTIYQTEISCNAFSKKNLENMTILISTSVLYFILVETTFRIF